MPPRKKTPEQGASVAVDSLKHTRATRKNIPTKELSDFVAEEERAPKTLRYPRNPDLDPQLVWRGKDEQDSGDLEVPVVPVYIQEKIHPQAIIEDVRASARRGQPSTLDLRLLLIAWWQTFKSVPSTGKEAIAQSQELIRDGHGVETLAHPELAEAIQEIAMDRQGRPSSRRLGKYLERYRERIESGARFVMAGVSHQAALWKVEVLDKDTFSGKSEESSFYCSPTAQVAIAPGSGDNPDNRVFALLTEALGVPRAGLEAGWLTGDADWARLATAAASIVAQYPDLQPALAQVLDQIDRASRCGGRFDTVVL